MVVLRTFRNMADRILSLVVGQRTTVARAAAPLPFRELDRVRTLSPIEDEDGRLVPEGSTGTVVAIWAEGAAFEVEFTDPTDTLATIEPRLLDLVERAVD